VFVFVCVCGKLSTMTGRHGECKYRLTHITTGVSLLHTLATLPSGKEHQLTSRQQPGWTGVSVCMSRNRREYLPMPGIAHHFHGCSGCM
jgi:hypothetical protein